MYLDENGLAEFTTKMKTYIDNKFAPTPQEEYFLTFSSPNSFTLSTANNTKNWDGTLEYSTDKTSWNTWGGTSAISSSNDGKLYIRGIGNTYLGGASGVNWSFTGSDISIGGNIENLLDYATVELGNHPAMATNCYQRLFQFGANITNIDNLILGAETLTTSCYDRMFWGIGITVLPVNLLSSATTLGQSCCLSMFALCSNITSIPANFLPETTLAYGCYQYMFQQCTGLITLPSNLLPATELTSNCYQGMFTGCTSLITLLRLPNVRFGSGSCTRMFDGCSRIKISAEQVGEYINEYSVDGFSLFDSATTFMFSGTGGTFTGTPTIGKIYYTSNEVV